MQRIHRQRVAAFTWLSLVAAFALWGTLTYRSLAGIIGEWEYRHLGQHLPIVTIMMLIAVLGSPALLLLWIHRRRHSDEGVADTSARTMRAEGRLLIALGWASGLSMLAALCTLGLTLTLPSAGGSLRPVSSSMLSPGEGAVRLTGRVIATRTATFGQNLLFFHRAVAFAPVETGLRSGVTRYFVEMSRTQPDEAANRSGASGYTGILKRNALPGAIIRLFEYAGFAIAKPHYVLFASRTSMLVPYYLTAANWLLASGVALLLALLQRWRLRRMLRAHPLPAS